MMATEVIDTPLTADQRKDAKAAQRLLETGNLPRFSISMANDGLAGQRFSAATYWPNGDVVRDRGCHGHGATVEQAIAAMLAKVEIAKSEVPKLKTAAECKAAVIDLIREHDAAPASFRDAVDALPVA